jgi:hypothetical protein
MPSTRVHNNHIKPFFFELGHTLCCDCDRIGFGVGTKVGDFGLGGRLTSLVERASAECICADNGGFESAFLVVDGQLFGENVRVSGRLLCKGRNANEIDRRHSAYPKKKKG